jgi:hypothetical protein
MNQTNSKHHQSSPASTDKKPGFIGKIFQKLDAAMKQKADEKSQQNSCCGQGNNKGGKCC